MESGNIFLYIAPNSFIQIVFLIDKFSVFASQNIFKNALNSYKPWKKVNVILC